MTSINNQQLFLVHVYVLDNWVHTLLLLPMAHVIGGSNAKDLMKCVVGYLVQVQLSFENEKKKNWLWHKWKSASVARCTCPWLKAFADEITVAILLYRLMSTYALCTQHKQLNFDDCFIRSCVFILTALTGPRCSLVWIPKPFYLRLSVMSVGGTFVPCLFFNLPLTFLMGICSLIYFGRVASTSGC